MPVLGMKVKQKDSVIELNSTDFRPLGCYRPIKNINHYAKFSQKSLILSTKVIRNLPK